MKTLISSRYQLVLGVTAISVFLLSGFIVTTSRIPVRPPKDGSADLSLRSAALPRSSSVGLATTTGPATQPRLAESYGNLPLSFEINRGQTDPQVKFLSRGSRYSLFLTGNEAVLSLKKPGASSQKRVTPPFRAARQGRVSDLFSKSAAFPGLLPTTQQFKESFAPREEARVPDAESRAPAVVRMQLVGANSQAKVSGLDELPGRSNYFIGSDPKKWRTNVPNYAKVKYANVYPGVDLVYYGNQGQLEYDFVVQPGADPRQIALALDNAVAPLGARPVRERRTAGDTPALQIDPNGNLVVGTVGGELVFHKPVVYQQNDDGNRHPIDGRYVLSAPQSAIDNRQSTISFELAAYDYTRSLVIDPTLAYSTYLGGSGSAGSSGIAADASGNAYVTGVTPSSDFPTTPGAFQTTFGGGHEWAPADAFVSKLNADGSALLYSTYLGGSGYETSDGMTVDASGNAFVKGYTDSSDFPTTAGAFQTALGGGHAILCAGNLPCLDAFVAKLNASGSGLVYSTYLGGSGEEGCEGCGGGIVVDASGNAYVTGATFSYDFPTTPDAFQRTFNPGGGISERPDAFVTKLNVGGSALLYSTFLGGSDWDSGTGIAVDTSGNAYVRGVTQSSDFPTTPGAFETMTTEYRTGFLSKLNAAGSDLVYSTYLEGGGIAVDRSGDAIVMSADTAGSFVGKLNPTGSALLYSTHLSGASAIAVDASDNAYVTGTDDEGTFVDKLNPTGSVLLYLTRLSGASASAIAVDSSGNAYITGGAGADFPITPGALQTTLRGGRRRLRGEDSDHQRRRLCAWPRKAHVWSAGR